MSLFGLRGRKFLDALQHHPSFPSSRFRLPCPPYDNPVFWDQLYKDMSYDQVNEWGGVDLSSSSSSGGLLQFRYQKVPIFSVNKDDNDRDSKENDDGEIISTTTFADWMDITQLDTPEEAIQLYQQQREQNEHQSDNNHSDNNNNEAILILGCGNSKLGEQLLINSFIGPILQLDISSKVIQLMTQRYHKYLSSDDSVVKRMEFMVDDASTGLTSLEPESVGGGVIDKGLVDVLHCSAGPISSKDDHDDDDHHHDDDMIQRIMNSVHNVLQPSRPFIFFSRSEPQWMLRRVFGHNGYDNLMSDGSQRRRRSKMLWKDVEVVKLVDYDLLLYKLVKAEKEDYNDEDDEEEQMGTKNSVIKRQSYLKRLKGGSKKSKR
ncbi:hypothetical protein QTG54_010524 [Skeletonema marinoi]|uniref:Methyltransferase-like protein 13 n=1 Tax=Skeletonema marinoi TaxID=267567 RepID=A0AAD9DA39_9STRA|nr:hypothetical protein QTG54_010524 [Skeletonema marinoi]